MKKWIALFLITALLLTCTACGDVENKLDDVAEQVGQEINKELTRGTIDGNVYTGEFAGITFTKPDAWVYSTDEEIAALMNVGTEIMNDISAYQKAINKMATVYDMMVVDPTTGSSVSVMYENLSVTGNTGLKEDAYHQAVKSQLEAQETISYTCGEISSVELSGETYRRMSAMATFEGMTMEQIYCVRAVDKYMHVIIITLVNGLPEATVSAMFS